MMITRKARRARIGLATCAGALALVMPVAAAADDTSAFGTCMTMASDQLSAANKLVGETPSPAYYQALCGAYKSMQACYALVPDDPDTALAAQDVNQVVTSYCSLASSS